MKKTLLCFLFLFTTTFYAQVSDMIGCQTYPIFDLTTRKAQLIGNLNPAETTVSFHLSVNDATNNANVIPNPTAYISETAKTIFARIDNKGAITTNFFNIVFPPPLQVIWAMRVPACENQKGGLDILATGGTPPYFYSIDNGQTYSTTGRFDYLNPGVYNIRVRDSYNCITQPGPVAQIPAAPSPLIAIGTVTEGVNCGDRDLVTLKASGGQGPYYYSFTDINNFTSVTTANNLAAGTRTLYVKDQNGCISSTTVTVNNFKATLSSTIDIQHISCVNTKGTITAKGLGGKSPYLYSLNGQSYQSNNVFTNLVPGSYEVKTKDDLGCEASLIGVITDFIPLKLNTFTATSPTCFGESNGSINVSVSDGKAPYSYSLKGISGVPIVNSQQSTIFTNLLSGTYTVEVTDAMGCIVSFMAEITQPSNLVAAINVQNKTIEITTTGGTGTHVYSLDGGTFQQNNIFTNVSYGTHEILIKDVNGCIVSMVADVKPSAPLVNGKNIITLIYKIGQTLADLIIDGQNIKWYLNQNPLAGKTSRTTEAPLPLTTVIVDGTTYYASQTIDGIESVERLAVTAKSNGALSTSDFNLPNFKFYPNPVKHILTLNNTALIDEIEIFSISGKSVLSKKLNSNHSEIDLSQVSSGLYLLKVKSEGKTKTIKFIKE